MSELSAPENTLGRHVRRTLVLAWPMILSRVGLVTMFTMDVIVLGRAGAGPLSEYVLGQAITDSLVAMIIGFLLGVPVLVARETGAGNDAACGTIWRRGLVLAAVTGVLLCLALQFVGPLFRATGQDPALAARAAAVTGILAFGMPFIALFYVSAALLEALHRPLVGFLAIAAGNVVNLGLNVLLVFGTGPVPPLGAIGCALASVATFAMLALTLSLYVRFALPGRHLYGIGSAPRPERPFPSLSNQIRMGLASGGSFLLEASAFAVLTLLIGRLGQLSLAAHGVLFQLIAVSFMIAFGIAGATQVRVGNAWGRNDPSGAAMAGWTGLALAACGTALLAIAVALAPGAFLRLFTSDLAIAAAALPALVWALGATVFDGGQSVMNNACRGRGDTWVPTALHFGSYWLVMVPGAWLMAFPLGMGLPGIYAGILVASVVSVTVLMLRFRRLTRAAPWPRSRPSSPAR